MKYYLLTTRYHTKNPRHWFRLIIWTDGRTGIYAPTCKCHVKGTNSL